MIRFTSNVFPCKTLEVGVYKTKVGRTLADALRELAREITLERLGDGQPLRHDKKAIQVAKRLVMAEARRLEAEST